MLEREEDGTYGGNNWFDKGFCYVIAGQSSSFVSFCLRPGTSMNKEDPVAEASSHRLNDR